MRHCYYLFLLIVLVSCKLKENPIFPIEDDIQDTGIVLMGSIKKLPEFSLTSFAEFPDEIQGCSCYFSFTKNAFKDEQYIYAGLLLDSISYVKKDGKWMKLAQFEINETQKDSVYIKAMNDSMKIDIKGKLDSSVYETRQYKGHIKVLKMNKEVLSAEVYGECGC